MSNEEKIFEKLDEVIKMKKQEIEGLRKLIGSIENPPDRNNKEEQVKEVPEKESEGKKTKVKRKKSRKELDPE